MKYNIIDLSDALHQRQKRHIVSSSHSKVSNLYKKSIFDWNEKIEEPCFVILNEVLDNFSCDLIAFDENGLVLEGIIEEHDVEYPHRYQLAFQETRDDLIIEFFNFLCSIDYKFRSAKWNYRDLFQPIFGHSYKHPYKQEFIPTMTFQLMKVLSKYFPNHRAIISDFDRLPDAIPGINSPVVQTRYKGHRVVSSTLLVEKGKFDIFFPTDFDLLQKMYGSLMPDQKVEILSNFAFHKQYAEYGKAKTKSGFNPLLEEFQNVKFLLANSQ